MIDDNDGDIKVVMKASAFLPRGHYATEKNKKALVNGNSKNRQTRSLFPKC